jgi:hypothetical protein
MKSFTLIILFLISSHLMASDHKILEMDPYSIDSIEKHFPKAVETETILDHGPHDYIKRIGPRTKEIKSVNYQVLIPQLIEVIKEQNKEIQALKISKMRNK